MESTTKSIILLFISRWWRLKLTSATILIQKVAVISGWSLNFSMDLSFLVSGSHSFSLCRSWSPTSRLIQLVKLSCKIYPHTHTTSFLCPLSSLFFTLVPPRSASTTQPFPQHVALPLNSITTFAYPHSPPTFHNKFHTILQTLKYYIYLLFPVRLSIILLSLVLVSYKVLVECCNVTLECFFIWLTSPWSEPLCTVSTIYHCSSLHFWVFILLLFLSLLFVS